MCNLDNIFWCLVNFCQFFWIRLKFSFKGNIFAWQVWVIMAFGKATTKASLSIWLQVLESKFLISVQNSVMQVGACRNGWLGMLHVCCGICWTMLMEEGAKPSPSSALRLEWRTALCLWVPIANSAGPRSTGFGMVLLRLSFFRFQFKKP